DRRSPRGARRVYLAPRVPRPGQRRGDGPGRRPDGGSARGARRGRGLPLLRPHLHHRLLPAPDRAAAHRRPRLPAARARRQAGRRPRSPDRLRGASAGLAREEADRCRGPPAAPRVAHARVHRRGPGLRHRRPRRRRLVSLLRRPRPQARRLLLDASQAHKRRPRAARLLLQGPQGLLRHVLRHQGALL
ncbi:MAG: hypothetical protein AVDCRST_MAG38-1561, partial [uncultured Solirubrobacteraceae bacterium]